MNTQADVQIREILSQLDTDMHSGLSDDTAQERLRLYGPNEIKEPERQTPIAMFLSQFKGAMNMLLFAAGIISAITGDIKDTIVIGVVILLNATMGFIQEYRAEKAIAALKKLAVPTVRVIRNGRLTEVHSNTLVPGDIVRLQAGDFVPADGRLIESTNLTINEAALTGESVPVEKDAAWVRDPDAPLGDRKCDVFMGTIVVQGRGTFVVEKTGMNTQLGNIAEMIEHTPMKQTPLQRRLAQLGVYLAIAAIAVCVIVLLVGLLQGRDAKLMLLAAISLAVAAVPESLPAVITISLALGAQRMVKRNALIRKLPAVETLGCVTSICTDKTGTLTQNRMQVDSLYVGGRFLKRGDQGFVGVESLLGETSSTHSKDLETILEVLSLCNDAEVQTDEDGIVRAIGDPTETSLILAAMHAGINVEEKRQVLRRVAEIPFDSARKRMTTIHQDQDGFRAFTKGAIDVVLPRCKFEMIDNTIRELNDERRAEILALSEQFASRGSRIIAAAFKGYSDLPDNLDPETTENNLVFLGFAAINDPPRPEAAASVRKCKEAGVRVIMVTGDHKLTAAAIATDLGIMEPEGAVCTGVMLDDMDDESLSREIEHCNVFARVAPEHKVRIVSALQSKGHIVAMTGDGVNDAPSLKRADVGVAMGITGTDVSREASDIVLTDDNFATIVAAIEEGRTIYDNIRKFVRYTIATNLGEILIMFFGMLSGLPIPLLPIQILWINLVTDGLPALALGVEPPEGDVMRRPPRDPNESIFAHGLWQHIVWVGVLMTIGTLILFAFEVKKHDTDYARTMAFFTMASFQLFHVLAIRRERESVLKRGIPPNRSLTLAVIGAFGMQIALIYVGALAEIFKNVRISFADLMLCVLVSSSVFFAVELEKVLHRKIYPAQERQLRS